MSIIDRFNHPALVTTTQAAPRTAGVLSVWTAALDAAVIGAAGVLAVAGRSRLSIFDGNGMGELPFAGALIIGAWIAALWAFGAYRPGYVASGAEEYRKVASASVAAAALVGIICYLAHYQLSRGFYVLLFGIGLPLLLLARYTNRTLVRRARARGMFNQRILLAGAPHHVEQVAAVLRREQWLGYSVAGCLVPEGGDLVETSTGIPVLGSISDASRAVDAHGIDVLFFTEGAFSESGSLREAAWDLEHHTDLEIIVSPGLTDVSASRVKIRPVAGLPLVHLERPRSQDAGRISKRIFDRVGAAVLIALSSPVWLAIALWIKLDDRGPVFFSQTRVGKDGVDFECMKFRSMVVNAEEKLAGLESSGNGVLFKSAHDPRVTRPGRFIRRFSLDELPQLLNVLKGDMSLVGPRPPLRREVDAYPPGMIRRLNVLPGLTGLWQVSGRSDLSWDDTVRLDLYYVDNWSMLQDMAILLRTVRAVLLPRGAY